MLGNDVIRDRDKLNKIIEILHLKIEELIQAEMKKLEINNPDFMAELIFVLLHVFGNMLASHCMAVDSFSRYMGITEKLNHKKFLEVVNELTAENIKTLQRNDNTEINITEH